MSREQVDRPTMAVAARSTQRVPLEVIRAPIVTTSMSGSITGLNTAAIALFGSPALWVGRGIREALSFVPEPGAPGSANTQGTLADLTGRVLDVDVSRTLIDPGTKQGFAVYVVHDITAHAEVGRLREQLLYSVAHELRGSLMVLDNALEILEAEFLTLSPGEFTQILKPARRTARRMRTLMEDLLSAGSIRSGRFVVSPRKTRLAAIVKAALEIVSPSIEARRQRVELDLPGSIPLVMADKGYARQVFSNLLANASKYSPEDGVIRVAACSNPQGMVLISVEDQGPGIPPEQQEGLFERFYRVRTENGAPGVGLGLAIARGIIEAHGGSIGMISQPGNGTRVWFTLPRAEQQVSDNRNPSANTAR